MSLNGLSDAQRREVLALIDQAVSSSQQSAREAESAPSQSQGAVIDVSGDKCFVQLDESGSDEEPLGVVQAVRLGPQIDIGSTVIVTYTDHGAQAWGPLHAGNDHRAAAEWHIIEDGVVASSISSVTISNIPTIYRQMRLTLRGRLSDVTQIQLRVNSDSTSGMHKSALTVRSTADFDNVLVGGVSMGDRTTWRIAEWGTLSGNTCTVDIMGLFGASPSLIGFQSYFSRNGITAGTHRYGFGHGRLNESRTLSSLFIGLVGTNDFTSLQYTLLGLVDPSGGLADPSV